MNATAATPSIVGIDLSALSGPWFLSEDRIRGLFARLRAMPQQSAALARVVDNGDDDGPDAPPSYSVSGGIARIDVCGTLTKYPIGYGIDEWCGFCPTMPLIDALNRALADWTVKGIVFVIDSPGGMVAGTNLLAEAIAAADGIKPCYAVVSDLAASGGYYLASQCRDIACNAMGEVGCIGVYTVLADWSKFYEQVGVSLTVVSSGGVKGLGADGTVSQELVDDQRRGVMGMYDKFVADVAAGRGISTDEARKLGDGRSWIAPDALKLGLIDRIALVDDAVAAASMEVQRMNAEQFKAFAAANPDDAAVKALIDQGYTKAKGEFAPKAATATELDAAFPGEQAFCFEQLKAGATLQAATLAYCGKLKADAAGKDKALTDQAEAHKIALAEKDKAIERAKFEAGGQPPVGTGTAAKETAGASKVPDAPESDDPKARKEWAEAKAGEEWDGNAESRKGYSTKARFVAIRAREILGQHRTLKK